MRRLRDSTGGEDPRTALAVELLSSRAPTQPSRQLLGRVRASLETPRRRVRGPGMLRPAVAALVVLGLITAASAMVYRRAVIQRPASQRALASAPSVRSRGIAHPTKAPVTVAALASPALAAPLPSAPTSAELPAPRRRARPPAARTDSAPAKSDAPAEISDPQADLVNEGFLALRSAREPARATRLFAEYLRRQPNGALAEEALALSIEAAASADTASQAKLAADYLRRFPAGRFRQMATRALANASR